jgi:dTDP-4-dehydrorhamnose 3,5-epimerase
LVTAEFNPEAEKGITPFCPKLAIKWDATIAPRVSQKDKDAPTLTDQHSAGNLPA